MKPEPIRPKPEEPIRDRPADQLNQDPSANGNLMWVFVACFLFLLGAGLYVSFTRGQGDQAETAPVTTDSAVAGAKSRSYQDTGQSGTGTGTSGSR